MAKIVRIQPVEQMAKHVFDQADLGDLRLNRRLLRVAIECLKHPGKTFNQIYGDWKQTKGAYRLIENPKVNSQQLFTPLEQAGGQICRGRKVVYAVQDTTDINFSHRKPLADLGPINSQEKPGQGLLLHSTLALDETGTPLGFLKLQCWKREPEELGKKYTRGKRSIEDKESYKWILGMEGAQQSLQFNSGEGAKPHVIHVMDREGDIFEVFEKVYELEDGLVVRAAWNRVTEDGQRLWTVMENQPLGGKFTIQVPSKKKQPARTAQVEIRWGQVILKPPRGKNKERVPLGVHVVWVMEPNPPENVKPVEWMLLTTEPVECLEKAMEIIEIYRYRWRIEDLHLILKSGCRIEERQFGSRDTIEKILALYLLSALRILMIRYLAENMPETPADQVLDQIEQKALRIYIKEHCNKDIGDQLTVSEVRFWIGRIGGHIGRKSDGQPGVRTLWRGWRNFELIVNTYKAIFPP